jgi:hypothetical protein
MRRIFVALLLACAAMGAAAEEPARFFIERVDVRNARRVSRDVIVAESRLRESRSYSEAELGEAAARLARAPYLLSADLALEKGSERGRYVLVITVNETKPFFYRLDFVPVIPSRTRGSVVINDVALASDNELAIGFRFFVGSRGEVHAGLEGAADNRSYTRDYVSYVAGYTQYDIFGTRAFVTINAKKPNVSNAGSSIAPQLVAGIPLSINQTVTASYDVADIQNDSRSSQRIVSVRWSFNTTNHPLLPTRGTYLTVAPIAVWHDAAGRDTRINEPPSDYLTHDRSVGIDSSAHRWWELPHRNSIGAGLVGGFAATEERGFRKSAELDGIRHGSSRFGAVTFTLAHSFWSVERVAKHGDSRLQLDARIGSRSEERGAFSRFESGHVRQVSIGWVRRTAWGLVRLGGGYSW